jgi:hypothetical protein
MTRPRNGLGRDGVLSEEGLLRHSFGCVRHEHTPRRAVKWHWLASLFPGADDPVKTEDLSADILQHGIREPVVFYKQFILDGRKRYVLARELGIPYPRVEYTGSDPLGYILEKNGHDRLAVKDVVVRLAKFDGSKPTLQQRGHLLYRQVATVSNIAVRALKLELYGAAHLSSKAKSSSQVSAVQLEMALSHPPASVSSHLSPEVADTIRHPLQTERQYSLFGYEGCECR